MSRNTPEWFTLDLSNLLYKRTMVPFYETYKEDVITHVISMTNLTTIFCTAVSVPKLLKVKGTKLSILRFRRRKHSMRKQGHRAKYTKIEIDKIKLESK